MRQQQSYNFLALTHQYNLNVYMESIDEYPSNAYNSLHNIPQYPCNMVNLIKKKKYSMLYCVISICVKTGMNCCYNRHPHFTMMVKLKLWISLLDQGLIYSLYSPLLMIFFLNLLYTFHNLPLMVRHGPFLLTWFEFNHVNLSMDK